MKRSVVVVFMILFLVSFVSAGWFGDLWSDFFGVRLGPPLGEGQGDCFGSDDNCEEGLICHRNAGGWYGMDWSVDICETWDTYKDHVREGERAYCKAKGPCDVGKGDCDTDADCKEGLYCKQYSKGSPYYEGGWVDVCLEKESSTPPVSGNLGLGKGDCDGEVSSGDTGSKVCGEGLFCLSRDIGCSHRPGAICYSDNSLEEFNFGKHLWEIGALIEWLSKIPSSSDYTDICIPIPKFHDADTYLDWKIDLSELLRVTQFYNSEGYHCQTGTEDSYALGIGDTSCEPHDSDYDNEEVSSQDWKIELSELLRITQFYNSDGYYSCPTEGTEDGFCLGVSSVYFISANKKDLSKYSDKEVFLVSDNDWREVLTLVPVTTWTGSEDCENNKGYGTAENVCVYPTLIWHGEVEGFDIDSSIYFMQQYNTEKIRVVGDASQELKDLLVTERDFGAGILEENIGRVKIEDYLSYWESFDSVVYVEDDYELALMASTYASLINVPLIIENYNEIDLSDLNIICVGNVGVGCDEQYDLEQLQQKYVDETQTDKIILVNPDDLDIKVEEEFETEKGGTIYEIYSKTSLAAPILASAKHEVILSTRETDYEEVDEFIESKINELGILDSVEYLTIMASPDAVQMAYDLGYGDYYSIDAWHYSLLDEDNLLDLAVGRIFSLTSSDISSNICRGLFYDKTLKNSDKILVTRGHSYGDSAARVYLMGSVLSEIGYNTIITPAGTQADDWEDKFFINYIDHGSTGWAGIGFGEIPYLDNSLITTMACSTCDFRESASKSSLFCANSIRKGAVAYIGAIDLSGDINQEGFLIEIFAKESSIGKGFINSKKVLGYGNLMPYYTLIGDPTFKLDLPYLMPEFELNFIEDINENTQRYNLSFPVMKFEIPEEVQQVCGRYSGGSYFITLNTPDDLYWAYFDSDSLDPDVSKINSIQVLGNSEFEVKMIDDNLENQIGFAGFNMDKDFLDEGLNILEFDLIIDTMEFGQGGLSPYKEIIFSNRNLEDIIREVIGKEEGLIYLKDVVYLKNFYIGNNQVSDISDLACLGNLEGLYIGNNQILDISSLSGLTNLEYLNFHDNSLLDISHLSGLTNLEGLYLHDNQISDISSLSGLTNLESLNLGNNQISDISDLAGLDNLKTVYIGNNQILDISSLSGLTNLESLNLGNNQISDISSLVDLISLEYLDFSYNSISDISVLSSLSNLKFVDLSGNPFEDCLVVEELRERGVDVRYGGCK